jgi:putative membrane protein
MNRFVSRLTSALLSCFVSGTILLATLPAFAQQPGPSPDFRGPGPMWGYGHMWGGGWGGGWHGMIIGPFVMLLAIIGIVALILWLVRAFSHGGLRHGHGACPHCGYGGWRGRGGLDILEERFARGEIDKNEFEERRRVLDV